MKKEKSGEISLARFEIIGLDKDTKARWKMLGNVVKRITNCFWRTWLVQHSQAGHPAQIRQYIVDLDAWYKNGSKGPKPKCEIKCLTPKITAAIRREINDNYPEANARCIDLALQLIGQRMISLKATKGNFSRWLRILADDGEFPNSANPLPIPFDKKNGTIIPPLDDSSDFQFKLRVDRIERPGKLATSTLDTFKLKTRGRKVASQTAILWKIASSEWEFCGSNLVFKESSGKWFVHVCYRRPAGEKPALIADKTAFLRAATRRPWWLRIEEFNHWVGGPTGRHVSYVRQQLLTNRWSRQEAYRYAGSARKGHGRDRAIGRLALLQTRWKDFVKTANQQLAHDVVERCIQKECGRLIYFQPADAARESRFLFKAGKVNNREDGTGWDWYQVQSILAYKCKEAGIELIVRKVGERRRLKNVA